MKLVKLTRSKSRPYIWINQVLQERILEAMDKTTRFTMIGYEHTPKHKEEAWDGIIHLLGFGDPSGYYFPIGLLPKVTAILRANGYQVEYHGLRKPDKTFFWNWHGPILRDYQRDTIIQTLHNINLETGCIVNLPTGSGKTMIAMWLMKELGVSTLICTHKKELMDQWCDEIEDKLHIKPLRYGGGSKADYQERVGITVSTVQTLAKEQNFDYRNFDLVIFDEAHHYSAPMFRDVAMKCNSFFRVGMSATTHREDGAELQFIGGIGKIISPVTAEWLIDHGYLTRPVLDIRKPIAIKDLGETWEDVYKYGVVLNRNRNALIANVAKDYIEHGKQVLIHVDQIKHGKELVLLTGIPMLTSKNSDEKRKQTLDDFKDKKIQALISTLLGEGVDIPSMDVIIFASAKKSFTKVIQAAGRALRIYEGKHEAIIVDFADSGHPWLRGHWQKRRMAYNEVFGV